MVPFYELLRKEEDRQRDLWQESQAENSWRQILTFYKQSQFFDDTPKNPAQLMRLLSSDGGLPWPVAIKLAYPLLLGVGTTMALFLGFHIRYILEARTTLEHKVVLETLYDSLWKQAFSQSKPTTDKATAYNPFNQGWEANLRQIIGPPWSLFFPVAIDPPPPFLPTSFDTISKKKQT